MSEKNKIINARSKENGIVFYSNKIPLLCYEAYYDENGEIQTKVQTSMLQDIKDRYGMLPSVQKIKKLKEQIIFSRVVLLLIAIFLGIAVKKISIVLALMYYSICININNALFFSLVREIKFGKYKSTGRFHSAEHMVINAYERYGRVPTMTELKRESRFSNNCGSREKIMKIVYIICIGIIFASYNFIPLHIYILEIDTFLLFVILDKKYNLLRFFQALVTNKPTEKELKLSLAGIELYDKLDLEFQDFPDLCIPSGFIVIEVPSDAFDEDDKN